MLDKILDVHKIVGAQAHMITIGLQCLNYFLLVPLGLEGGKGTYLLFNALFHLANTKSIIFAVFKCLFCSLWDFSANKHEKSGKVWKKPKRAK